MPVAAVARRLGVAPATLRTWDRRYGLGPSRHVGGKHRRYGTTDIQRLEIMQRALLRGASTAEAAQYALAASVSPGEPAQPPPVVPAPAPDRSVARRLRMAALAMDGIAVQRVLAEAIADGGVLAAWENVIDPVLSALGAAWGGSHAEPEAEHLLAECVYSALVRATPVLTEPRNQRPVLLTAVPGEPAGLSLYALAACLVERRIHAQLFGGTGAEVLARGIRRMAPAAVVVHARQRIGDRRLFSRVSSGRQRCRWFGLGQGWSQTSPPDRVELLPDLRAAVERVEFVLLGG